MYLLSPRQVLRNSWREKEHVYLDVRKKMRTTYLWRPSMSALMVVLFFCPGWSRWENAPRLARWTRSHWVRALLTKEVGIEIWIRYIGLLSSHRGEYIKDSNSCRVLDIDRERENGGSAACAWRPFNFNLHGFSGRNSSEISGNRDLGKGLDSSSRGVVRSPTR